MELPTPNGLDSAAATQRAVGVFADADPPAADGGDLAVVVERGDAAFEVVDAHRGVRVDPRHVAASGRVQTDVQGVRDGAVGVVQQPDAWVRAGELGNHRNRRVVRRRRR